MNKPKLDKTIGPELHRIKPLENYDHEVFNKLYRICKPVIRNLVKQIDCRRYNVSKDVISSYFWDKMLFLFNRYYEESEGDVEFLKAHVLKGLQTYKYHLLQEAYSERSEYFQGLISLDSLYESNNNRECLGDEEDVEDNHKEELLKDLYNYMGQHLSPDAMLIFECLMTPIDFFLKRTNQGTSRITNQMFVEFFELPVTKSSMQYISELRQDVLYWEQRAMEDLKH